MVDGKVTVMPNAFGEFGEGLLNVSKLRTGEVTLARLAGTDGTLAIHCAHGRAITPEKWEEAGWAPPAPQLPSLEVVLDGGSEAFLSNVMGQHYIVSYGDWRRQLAEFCAINGMKFVN
jgi:L-fucose isomerase-like protein